MHRLRPLDEQECYLRCYGWTGSEDAVKVIRPSDLATAATGDLVLAERYLRAFESRLAASEAEAA
jgi:hypothetical protein